MTVIYVDTEHARVHEDADLGPPHCAHVEQARERLEEAAGRPCLVLPWAETTPDRVARLDPAALVIGGNTTDWALYLEAELAGLMATIRAAPVPILGICAGHQLIGRAHCAAWGSLGALQPGEIDPAPDFAPGQRKEFGFLPVVLDARCPLFADLPEMADFYQYHYWQLVDAPEGFVRRAHSPWSAVQAIERSDRPVFGVQFHPERYDAAHPSGAEVLRIFFALI